MKLFTLSILLVIGILLTYYGFVNVSLSAAPEDLKDIFQKYNNTYALKVLPNSDNPEQIKIIKDNMNNARVLMILSIISGLYIIIYCIYEFICSLYMSSKFGQQQKGQQQKGQQQKGQQQKGQQQKGQQQKLQQ
jgi:hypothetical protein